MDDKKHMIVDSSMVGALKDTSDSFEQIGKNLQAKIMASKKPCPDCGVKFGETHEPGCDWENCVCGVQKIQCDEHNDKARISYGFEPIDSNDFWLEFYIVLDEETGMGRCGLCDQSGMLLLVNGAQTPCICPNGRAIKAQRDAKKGGIG